LLLSIAHFLFQSTAKYYELFLTKTPTIFDHITTIINKRLSYLGQPFLCYKNFFKSFKTYE
ncbi:hypothetical protein, partial [Chryseobacterium sp. RR2-3-20]|uniref:hypothetical protein n=1 Tax=Chryseobacterium sp. RR2-3-20 TaxID=2787626 RepID=UPI001ADF4374